MEWDAILIAVDHITIGAMARTHIIRFTDFEALAPQGWGIPIQVAQASLVVARSIPKSRFVQAWLSGHVGEPRIVVENTFSASGVVAGIDIVRYDYKDARFGYPFNIDRYIVVPTAHSAFAIKGPYGPGEDWHWQGTMPTGVRWLNLGSSY